MVWYSHFFQNFPQFIVIHRVKGFGIVNKAEIDVFLELSCFFDDPGDVSNLISGSNEYSGLISLKIDWFDLLAVQRTLESPLPTLQFESINSLVLSLLYGPTLTSIHDYWKNHTFDYIDICGQSDASAF